MRCEILTIRMLCDLRVKSVLNALLLRRLDSPVGRANGLDYGSPWFKSHLGEIIFVKKIRLEASYFSHVNCKVK